jgi:hypothetical protein
MKKINMASDGIVKTTDQNPVTASEAAVDFHTTRPVKIAVSETIAITSSTNSI